MTQVRGSRQDPLRQFFEECVVIDPQGRCNAQELFEAYQEWTARAGLRFPLSKNTFGAMLKERASRRIKTATGPAGG